MVIQGVTFSFFFISFFRRPSKVGSSSSKRELMGSSRGACTNFCGKSLGGTWDFNGILLGVPRKISLSIPLSFLGRLESDYDSALK